MTQVDFSAIKEQQKEQWGRAAAGWKKHDERLSSLTAPVSQKLLELAGVAPGGRVLDIACGTGEPAIPAARAVGAAGYVLATDMAPEMIEVAREKAAAEGLSNIEFRLVDGEEIDVPPESFDAVTCRWGMMFMPEPLGFLHHARQALKPDGRIALSVWGPPERNPFIALPMGIVRKHYQGPPLPDPAGPGGIFSFADERKLQFVFEQATFQNIRVDPFEVPMAVFESGKEYLQYMKDIAGPLATLLNQLPAKTRTTVEDEIVKAAPQGSTDGKVSLTGYTLLASARK
jgi:2-polyprenyl-3-methyl-5-hydroxy-6-metoxy-1,4-benzoquinol methylase